MPFSVFREYMQALGHRSLEGLGFRARVSRFGLWASVFKPPGREQGNGLGELLKWILWGKGRENGDHQVIQNSELVGNTENGLHRRD